MSVSTLIIGDPGTGKTTSLRNLDPQQTLLIQCLRKPLPFPSKEWKEFKSGEQGGSIYRTDNSQKIVEAMKRTKRPIIVIDDWNMIMTSQYMRRSAETGFQKFADIGRDAWNVLMAATELPDDVRVYFLGHTEVSDTGRTKAKTIGKMLDSTVTVESMFTIVLKSMVTNDVYQFSTQNNGSDSCKSPMGMFANTVVDNDLSEVDKFICDFYNITNQTKE